MAAIQPSPLLKLALVADAAVSLAVAVLQLALLDYLSGLLALPRALLLESGVFLVGYALLLAYLAKSRSVPRALILFLVVGNVGWALGCALAFDLTAPGVLGTVFLIIQAVTVLLFAALQVAGLKRSSAAPSPLGARQSA